jgi:hypothetical protein
MKDLGYSNSWSVVPKEVIECAEKGHVRKVEPVRKNVEKRTCDVCENFYCVDSGD